MNLFARVVIGGLLLSLALPAFAGGAVDPVFVPRDIVNQTKARCLSEAIKAQTKALDDAAKAVVSAQKAAEEERDRAIKAARDAYDARMQQIAKELNDTKEKIKTSFDLNQKQCQQIRSAIK